MAQSVSQQVSERLAPFLGSFNAEVWVKTVAERKVGVSVDRIDPTNLQALLEGLRPSLNTFMGRAAADELLQRIAREVR